MTNDECRISNRPRQAGIILLEVLLALALFVLAATVVGSALHSVTLATMRIRDQARAVDLAQTVLAELATGQIDMVDTSASEFIRDTAEGESVNVAEGWTYEILAEQLADLPALQRVTVIVRNEGLRPTVCRYTQWMLDTAAEDEFEVAEGGGR